MSEMSIEELARFRYGESKAALETYIREYLKRTGETMENTVLCERSECTGKGVIETTYWLETKADNAKRPYVVPPED